MRIYISGKITGTDDYIDRFASAEKILQKIYGDVIVNPAKVNSMLPKCMTYDDYMSMSLHMLKMCDTIFMLDGWTDSNGAKIEYRFARSNGHKILFQYDMEALFGCSD